MHLHVCRGTKHGFAVTFANSQKLLLAVRDLIVPFVRAADDAAAHRQTGRLPLDAQGHPRNVLVDTIKPQNLAAHLKFVLPDQGQGREGLLEGIARVLKYSVNTWDQGFLDKLYSSNNPVCWATPNSTPGIHHVADTDLQQFRWV